MSRDPGLRFLLARHGEATGNAAHQFIGSRDDELTSRGVEQAHCLAAGLSHLPITAIRTSPSLRAARTAEIAAATLSIPITVDPRLIEQNFGEWEGRPAVDPDPAGERLAPAWTALDVATAPPGGESLTRVQERVLGMISEIDTTVNTGMIVLVSHVGPIKALLCAALGAPLEAARHMFLDTGSLSVIDWKPYPLVRVVNQPVGPGWRATLW